MEQKELYMRRAIELAEHGLGHVSPNPLVGAILVKDGKIIGEGWHEHYGQPHAEVNAIRSAIKNGYNVGGSTLYCTLEPCNHTGKQPPCTKAIRDMGIERVVFAISDLNSVAAGGGAALRSHGIAVESGLCKDEAAWQNRVFFNWVASNRPYVCVKVAVSEDYKMAGKIGERTAITGSVANEFTQHLRQWCDAILVGAGTVAIDNPSLTVHAAQLPAPSRNPLRVVIDGEASIPLHSAILQTPGTIVFVSAQAQPQKIKMLQEQAEVVVVNGGTIISLDIVLQELKKRGITSVLVEGGAVVLEQFLASGLVDEWILLKAPKILPDGLQFLKDPKSLEEQFDLKEKINLDPDTAFVYVKKRHVQNLL